MLRSSEVRLRERWRPALYTVPPGSRQHLRKSPEMEQERKSKEKVHTEGVITGAFRMTCICQISVAHLMAKLNEGEGHSKARQGKGWGIS